MKVLLLTIFIFCIYNTGIAENPDKIIFSHKFHIEDVEAECSACHENTNSSISADDNLFPEMQTCYNCHDEDDSECGLCHTNTDEPGIAQRPAQLMSKFPHKNHTADKTSDCISCHEGIQVKEEAGSFHIPCAQLCITCHSGLDYSENSKNCLICHQSDMSFIPTTHIVNWKKDHGLVGQFDSNSCNHCHQQFYCQNCHQGENLDQEVHPLNFRTVHGIMAKGNKENCLTCHEEQLFCLDCHQTQMVMPKNHSYVNWSNRIPGSGGRHAKEAKFDMDNCMSCHNDAFTDVVCVICHGN